MPNHFLILHGNLHHLLSMICNFFVFFVKDNQDKSCWNFCQCLSVFTAMLFTLQTANDFMVICNVAKILELVVPLMEHPSETFLATIEEDLMKLIIKYGMTVRSSLSSERVHRKRTKFYFWNLNNSSYNISSSSRL